MSAENTKQATLILRRPWSSCAQVYVGYHFKNACSKQQHGDAVCGSHVGKLLIPWFRTGTKKKFMVLNYCPIPMNSAEDQ